MQRIQKTEMGVYQCLFCLYQTKQLWHCREHVISKHSLPEELPCPACGRICKDSVALRNHKRAQHKDVIWVDEDDAAMQNVTATLDDDTHSAIE